MSVANNHLNVLYIQLVGSSKLRLVFSVIWSIGQTACSIEHIASYICT